MSRFRLPRIESSDAAKARELHAELADRAETKRAARTRSTRSQIHAERTDDPPEGGDTR